MKIISNFQAQSEYTQGLAVIIDVREPIEFNENHLPGALNIPSTEFDLKLFQPFKDRKICLVCESGNRASKIGTKLLENEFTEVYLLENQMASVKIDTPVSKGWTVDRQFRFFLGLLLAIFLIAHFMNFSGFIAIPIILSFGLLFTALINRCYLRMGIAMLPWNKGKKE